MDPMPTPKAPYFKYLDCSESCKFDFIPGNHINYEKKFIFLQCEGQSLSVIF